MVFYPAARSDPVSHSQSGQTDDHGQHHQQLDGGGLLSQTGQVLVPDAQQLLLAVWMSHKLKTQREVDNELWVLRPESSPVQKIIN